MTERWKGGIVALAAGLIAWGAPAQATWLKATSKHFVVYSDTDEVALRTDTAELERFDTLLRRFMRLPPNPDGEFNKVTVYVLPSIAAVQGMSRQQNVAGFYIPRVTGSVAFTPRMPDEVGDNAMSPRVVLFHEYAHHFLLGNYALAYPAWFSEGFAEFASTTFRKGDQYWIGAPAQHRAYGLLMRGKDLTVAQLFQPPAKMSDWQTEALYGRGWLLTHMVEFDPALRTQFLRYLTLLNGGMPSGKAAVEAFGDLKLLDKKADTYLNQSKIPALPVKAASLPEPELEVRALTAGEVALIRTRMDSTRGVDAKTAGPIWVRAKAAAARFPTDAVAQGWLAEMAFDARDLDASEAAADRAIAIDPASSQGLLYKARVRMARLTAAGSHDEKAWKEARSWIIKANRAQTNDAAALALFYQSFDLQQVPPSKGAIAGLYRAVDLVPQDQGLRFSAARQRLLDGDSDGAKALLRPLAYDPHAGSDNPAARLLAVLDTGADGRTALGALQAPAKALDGSGAKPGD